MKAAPGMKADIRLSISFPCGNRKQNCWYPGGYFKMRKQLKFFWIWRFEILWKIFSNLYFHYGTSCENPICFPHYTFSAYRWEDVFVPSDKIFVAPQQEREAEIVKQNDQHDDTAHFGVTSQNDIFLTRVSVRTIYCQAAHLNSHTMTTPVQVRVSPVLCKIRKWCRIKKCIPACFGRQDWTDESNCKRIFWKIMQHEMQRKRKERPKIGVLRMRTTGLEPARRRHQNLNLARLPIPPCPQSTNAFVNKNRKSLKPEICGSMRHRGFEPRTTWLKVKCSTDWANTP